MIYYNVLREEECTPNKVKEGDAAMDLKIHEDVQIWPQQTVKLPVGICFEIPDNNSYVEVSARSSIALKGVYCHVGTIDRSFNGKEVCLIVTNIGEGPVAFNKGERIGQAVGKEYVVLKKAPVKIESAGSKEGFGSSGRF